MEDGEAGTGTAPRMRVGALLARALAFSLRHLPALALLGGVVYLPLLLLELTNGWKLHESGGAYDPGLTSLIGPVLAALLQLLLQVFLTLAVFRHLRGEPAHLSASIGRGFSSLLPVLRLAIRFGFVLFVALLVTGILTGIARTTFGQSETMVRATGIVTLLAFAWVAGRHFVSPQALVVESLSARDAMGRGMRLTEPARWRIFALVVLFFGVWWGTVRAGVLLLLPHGPWTWGDRCVAIGLYVGVTALVSSFAAVCAAVAYHDLRHAQEGVSLDDLLRVFE